MNRFVLIASFCLVFLFAPLQARAQQKPLDTVLPNGLRLIVVPDHLAPVVTTEMTYGVGSDDDTMPGVAHATEHMLFRSIAGLSSAQFADMAARMGARYNASTTNEQTQYYFTAPAQYLPLILRIEAMRMNGAYIADSEWATERGAIEQEILGDESNPYQSVVTEMRDALLQGTPYARWAGGTVPSFEGMRASDIRAFYRTWYHPNNATLVIAGGVDARRVLRQTEAIFQAIPRTALPSRAAVNVPVLKPVTLQRQAGITAPLVALGYRFPAVGSPDYAAGLVLFTALANERGPLTELALARKTTGTSISSNEFKKTGIAYILAGVSEGHDPLGTQRDVDAVLQTLLTKGVSSEFIDIAKKRILSGRYNSLSTISGLAGAWAETASNGWRSPQALYDRIAGTTVADVNRVLRAYFQPDQRIVVIITPSGGAVASAAQGFGVENVAYAGSMNEGLPSWATAFFRGLRPPPPLRHVTTYMLPNGIELAVQRQNVAPFVVLLGAIKLNETLHAPPGKDGVADMTSSLMQWGGGGYSRTAFAAATDALPATVLAGSHFFLTTQSQTFDRALALLAAEELRPNFPEDGLALLRTNIASELRQSQTQPGWKARMDMEAALYPPADPVRRHPTAATTSSLTLADIQSWYASAYRPDLTTIAVVGDVSPAYVRAEVQKYFGAWRAYGPKPDFHYPNIKMNGPSVAAVGSPNAQQTVVQLTELLPIHRDDPDHWALQVADTILTGEGTRSLLFDDLRKATGFVYGVSSTLDIGNVRSTYQFEFAADPKNAPAATARLLADLRHLQRDLLSKDDLLRAKQTILARSVLPQGSYFGLASEVLGVASDLRSGGVRTTMGAGDWHKILSLTPAQVRDAFAKWVRVDDFVRVTISPASAK